MIGPNVTIDEDCVVEEGTFFIIRFTIALSQIFIFLGARLSNVVMLKGSKVKAHAWVN